MSPANMFLFVVLTLISTSHWELEARGEEMRYYIRCSPDRHFHHLYQSRNRRIFTTDHVTFVETDI